MTMTSDRAVPALDTNDQRELRNLMGHFATGVVIVTADDDEGPAGMTLQSFTSLSLDPPLVLFCPAKTSTSWPRLQRHGLVTVNVLDSSHEEVCRKFAVSGGDKFQDVSWEPAPLYGGPVIDDAIAWIECRIQTIHDGGDHWVVIASVDGASVSQADAYAPLVFYRGAFGGFGQASA